MVVLLLLFLGGCLFFFNLLSLLDSFFFLSVPSFHSVIMHVGHEQELSHREIFFSAPFYLFLVCKVSPSCKISN